MKKLFGLLTLTFGIPVLVIPVAASGTLKTTPLENRVSVKPPVREGAILEYCPLTATNGNGSSIWGGESYGIETMTYFDPQVNCTYPTIYPYEITSFSFTLFNAWGNFWPYSIDVVVHDLNVPGDPCQGPGEELCRFTVSCDEASFSYPNVGTAYFPQPCCVYGPFYIGLQYTSTEDVHPAVVFDDQSPGCCDNWEFDPGARSWYDWCSFWAPPIPGYPLFWLEGQTPPNNCDQGDCQNHKMHFPQLPDPNGWDVNATAPTSLADDWQCSETGLIDDIHFWGSWKDDVIGEIQEFIISIHDNIPQGPNGYSVPGNIICGPVHVPAADVIVTPLPPSSQGWFDPVSGEILPDNHQQYFRYDYIEPGLCSQVVGEVYWLSISAVVTDPDNTHWGWKSTQDHFMDDAVWGPGPDIPLPPEDWTELYEPQPPPDPIQNDFGIIMDTQGNFAGGFGYNSYPGGEQNSGWWYYQYSDWWNVWFYDHPLDPSRKKEFVVNGDLVPVEPGADAFIEIAINWSTDQWETGGPPPIPDLIDPGLEPLVIGREQVFLLDNQPFTDPIPISYFFELLPYNPEWVSIDVRGFNFSFEGTIQHTCLPRNPDPQSLDLSFCITGNAQPQTGACCYLDGTCANMTFTECIGSGGNYLGDGTACSGDGDGDGFDDTCEQSMGACCYEDGVCTHETEPGCAHNGGTFMGVGTACSEVQCGTPNIPTMSQWGMLVLALLLVAAGTVAVVRRRRQALTGT